MSGLFLGQLLLGLLAVVGLVTTALLVGQVRQIPSGMLVFRRTLRWLPIIALVIMAGGAVLAENSLLTIQNGQGVDELSGFVIGACLVIFADLCVALAFISLRDALKTARAAADLEALLSSLSPQENNTAMPAEEE